MLPVTELVERSSSAPPAAVAQPARVAFEQLSALGIARRVGRQVASVASGVNCTSRVTPAAAISHETLTRAPALTPYRAPPPPYAAGEETSP